MELGKGFRGDSEKKTAALKTKDVAEVRAEGARFLHGTLSLLSGKSLPGWNEAVFVRIDEELEAYRYAHDMDRLRRKTDAKNDGPSRPPALLTILVSHSDNMIMTIQRASSAIVDCVINSILWSGSVLMTGVKSGMPRFWKTRLGRSFS